MSHLIAEHIIASLPLKAIRPPSIAAQFLHPAAGAAAAPDLEDLHCDVENLRRDKLRAVYGAPHPRLEPPRLPVVSWLVNKA